MTHNTCKAERERLKEYARKYVLRHPVSNYSNRQLSLLLFALTKIPKRKLSIDKLSKEMGELSSWVDEKERRKDTPVCVSEDKLMGVLVKIWVKQKYGQTTIEERR